MSIDVTDLNRFYNSVMGTEVSRILSGALKKCLNPEKIKTLSIGYGFPYDDESLMVHAALEHFGVLQEHGQTHATTLIDEERFPFKDESFDNCFLIHALEHAQHQKFFLREVWRILKPNGKVIVVLPNRRGLWARFDNNPFGMGQPYTKEQAFALLRDNLLEPLFHERALFHPPFFPFFKSYFYAESVLSWIFAKFSGVIIIEAEKRVYCPVIKGKRQMVMNPGFVSE